MSSSLIVWPARVLGSCVKGIKAALGPLITRDFWVKVMALCAKEMVAAFMKTLGGKFMSYGVSREDPDIKKASQQTTTASSAFSGGSPARPDLHYGSHSAFNQYSSRPAAFPGFNS